MRSAESRGGKRKQRGDSVSDVTERSPSRNGSGGGSGSGSGTVRNTAKRFRRASGGSTSNKSHQDMKDESSSSAPAPSVDQERWKKHLTYRRTQSFSRDPLGLDTNPPPPEPLPPTSVRSNGGFHHHHHQHHSRSSRNTFSHQRQSKDRIISPPKQVMCPDPLQLEVKIQAYQASHQRSADGKTKREAAAERYRYGNYDRYYGYRGVATDPRYALMRREWLEGRDCLDIGCNTGQFTLALTTQFHPRTMVGIDIDPKLVAVAKRNVRHYLTRDVCRREGFPVSLPILHGPVAAPLVPNGDGLQPCEFPFNVAFVKVGLYVLKSNTIRQGTAFCL